MFNRTLVSGVWQQVLDLVFPPHCVSCGKFGAWWCDRCFDKTHLEAEWDCLICERYPSDRLICDGCRRLVSLNGLVVAGHHQDELRAALHGLKYQFVRDLAKPLSHLLVSAMEANVEFQQALDLSDRVVLIPIPLHKKRLRWRGFNQTKLLAQELLHHFPWMELNLDLFRSVDTKTQMQLERSERMKNVEGIFSYRGPSLAGKLILILDDVVTSGATVLAAAEALRHQEPQAIWGVALAHGK